MKRIFNIIYIILLIILETGIIVGITALADCVYYDFYADIKENQHVEFIDGLTQEAIKNPELAIPNIVEILEVNKAFGDKNWALDEINKTSLTKDYVIPILESASSAGISDAQFYLGAWYMGWKFDDQLCVNEDSNYEMGAFWLLQAAKQDHHEAQGCLGMRYLLGEGVEQNFEKCIEWISKGAEGGDPDALWWLGKLNYHGLYEREMKCKFDNSNLTYYVVTWENWLKGKDEHGLPVHCYKGGQRVYGWDEDDTPISTSFKHYIKTDINKAKYYWELAAKQGHKEAKEALQKIYTGDDV